MRNISILNLMSLISQKENEVSDIVNRMSYASVVQKHIEIETKSETVLNEVEDFDLLYDDYIVTQNEVSECRGALAETNATTLLSNGRSIIQSINDIKGYRNVLYQLDRYINKKETLNRRFDGNGGSSYYEKNELNYSVNAMREEKDKYIKLIEETENEISTLNATTLVQLSF